jgi:magnesium-transporting ATPase (P-type)
MCNVLYNNQKNVIQSQDVHAGDIIYMEKGEKFSVDVIILSSSHEDGTVFIATAELDGFYFYNIGKQI